MWGIKRLDLLHEVGVARLLRAMRQKTHGDFLQSTQNLQTNKLRDTRVWKTPYLKIVTPHFFTIPLELMKAVILKLYFSLQSFFLCLSTIHWGVQTLNSFAQCFYLSFQSFFGDVDLENVLVELLDLITVLLDVDLPHTQLCVDVRLVVLQSRRIRRREKPASFSMKLRLPI